jgi:hypothetical protein
MAHTLTAARPACDRPGTLIEATRKLLHNDKRSRPKLAKDLEVPFHWLKAFMADEIDAPSVNRVQYIYEKLSGSRIAF